MEDKLIEEIPLVCNMKALNSDEYARLEVVINRFGDYILGAEPLANGMQFHVPKSVAALQDLSEFSLLEGLCCPFLDFKLVVGAGAEQAEFEITGPAGTTEFLRAEFRMS